MKLRRQQPSEFSLQNKAVNSPDIEESIDEENPPQGCHIEDAKTKFGTLFFGILLMAAGTALLFFGFRPNPETPSGSTEPPTGSPETPNGNPETPNGNPESPTGSTETPKSNPEPLKCIPEPTTSKPEPLKSNKTSNDNKIFLTCGFVSILLGLFCFVVSILMFKDVPCLYNDNLYEIDEDVNT